MGWEKTTNRCWKVEWLAAKWGQIVSKLWTIKGDDHMKVFIWKALMGALPTGENVVIKGIGSEMCKGCNLGIETMHHLF